MVSNYRRSRKIDDLERGMIMTIDAGQIDHREIANELDSFRETVKCLSSSDPRLVEQYPKQWVAICTGHVRAHGPTFQTVLEKLDSDGFSREQSIIRYVDPEPKTMIL